MICKVAAWSALAMLVAAGPLAMAQGNSSPVVSKEIAAAVADSTRPATDTSRDANRKPAETLAFTGVKPGDRVADYAAGNGYFTRLFSGVVGSTGHVYAVMPYPFLQFGGEVKGLAELETFGRDHPNVTVTSATALEGT
jgi:predicted methyltransferase